jgi:hypothetical protein
VHSAVGGIQLRQWPAWSGLPTSQAGLVETLMASVLWLIDVNWAAGR